MPPCRWTGESGSQATRAVLIVPIAKLLSQGVYKCIGVPRRSTPITPRATFQFTVKP